MPNFNTKEMKVALLGNKNASRFPLGCIEKLKEALKYCLDANKNVTMVVSFLGYFIHGDDFTMIQKYVAELSDGGIEIVNWMSNLLILHKGVHVSTIVLCGSHSSAAEIGSKKKRARFSEVSLLAHGVQMKRAWNANKDGDRANTTTTKKASIAALQDDASTDSKAEFGPLTQEISGLGAEIDNVLMKNSTPNKKN